MFMGLNLQEWFSITIRQLSLILQLICTTDCMNLCDNDDNKAVFNYNRPAR